jgi:hypothetical protein
MKVQRDSPLVGVQVQEQAAVFGVGNIAGKWTAPPRQVALWRLDLDHLGAEVRQQTRSEGCRYSLAAFNYQVTRQRSVTAIGVGER